VESLVELYTKNRNAIKRYGVALYVDITYEDFSNAGRNYAKDEWYLHCVDHENKMVRHDELAMNTLRLKDGDFANVPATVRSLVFHDDKMQQVSTSRSVSASFDANSDESTKEEFLVKQTNFDPWDLPLIGPGVLVGKRIVEPSRSDLLNKCQIFDIDHHTLHETKVRFTVPGQNLLYKVQFTTASGNMPTKVEMECMDEQFRGVMWSARTKWKKHGDAWLPVNTVSVLNAGKPEKPDARRTYEWNAFWVIGKQMPDEVFAVGQDAFIKQRELRERIVEFASVAP
jgi:hypothetical protein